MGYCILSSESGLWALWDIWEIGHWLALQKWWWDPAFSSPFFWAHWSRSSRRSKQAEIFCSSLIQLLWWRLHVDPSLPTLRHSARPFRKGIWTQCLHWALWGGKSPTSSFQHEWRSCNTGTFTGVIVRAPRSWTDAIPTAVGRIMTPREAPQKLWICYLTGQKRLCRCDKVKDLEMGSLSWWAKGITSERGRSRRRSSDNESGGWRDAVSGRKRPRAKERDSF